jgi:hypothetical protein
MRRGRKLGKALGGEGRFRQAAAFVVFGLGCLLVWFFLTSAHRYPHHTPSAFSDTAANKQSVALDPAVSQYRLGLPSRPLFPYSVIPGGVENEGELRRAIENDPVIATHYQRFNLARSRVIRVDHERAVYVSYRLDSHIYWTNRKLWLAKGESLITDGETTARTRCGNQISEVPVGPTSPVEPTVEALEKPEDPPLLTETGLPFELPLGPPPASDIAVIGHQGGIFIPPIFPIYFGNPGSNPGIPVSPPPPPPPPLPTQVPEPDTLLLISVGLSSVWMLRRKRKS